MRRYAYVSIEKSAASRSEFRRQTVLRIGRGSSARRPTTSTVATGATQLRWRNVLMFTAAAIGARLRCLLSSAFRKVNRTCEERRRC